MGELLLSVVSSVTISGLLVLALIFLSKTWMTERLQRAIRHEYDEKLETHKAQLKALNEVEIERFRSSLTRLTAEHQIRFSEFHTRLVAIVPETYGLLRAYRQAVLRYIEPFVFRENPPMAEMRAQMDTANKKFWEHFGPNELYFTECLATDIRELAQTLFEIGRRHFLLYEDPDSQDRVTREGRIKKWETKAVPALAQEGTLFAKIKLQMQELIGVESIKIPNSVSAARGEALDRMD